MTALHTALHAAPLLSMIAAQAGAADSSRSVAPEIIAALKKNDVMRLSASREIDGLEASIASIGRELEAIAAACGSTGWCMWNHLCVFHFYCGQLGATHAGMLRDITRAGHWVCFPAGAGTSVKGRIEGNEVVLNGEASFGSGGRYADFIGVIFLCEDPPGPRFTLLRTSQPGIHIDPTWKAMSLRASATDHVRYTNVRAPMTQVVPYTV
ncbi:MAG: acyl-CoA dehydrogenase family protein, partial [Alphaproteobacteria bacterium]